MADRTIPSLDAATLPLAGDELVHLVQGGNSRRVPIFQFLLMQLSATNQAAVRESLSASLRGHISGLAMTPNAGDAANDIDISIGDAASDATDPNLMVLTAGLTKRLDAAWAVGSGNGGLDTGAVGNNVYFVWLIKRLDTGVEDVLFSLSSSAPTMPANYTHKRLIGKFARTGGVNRAPRAFGVGDVTDWVAYTPVFTGFGTVTAVSMWSRRVGDTLSVRGKFTTGTPTATEVRVSLGFSGSEGNVVSDAAKVNSLQLAGTWLRSAGAPVAAYQSLVESGIGYMTVAAPATGGAGKLTGSAFGTGELQLVALECPIAGW